jgi:hypothetical protein
MTEKNTINPSEERLVKKAILDLLLNNIIEPEGLPEGVDPIDAIYNAIICEAGFSPAKIMALGLISIIEKKSEADESGEETEVEPEGSTEANALEKYRELFKAKLLAEVNQREEEAMALPEDINIIMSSILEAEAVAEIVEGLKMVSERYSESDLALFCSVPNFLDTVMPLYVQTKVTRRNLTEFFIHLPYIIKQVVSK